MLRGDNSFKFTISRLLLLHNTCFLTCLPFVFFCSSASTFPTSYLVTYLLTWSRWPTQNRKTVNLIYDNEGLSGVTYISNGLDMLLFRRPKVYQFMCVYEFLPIIFFFVLSLLFASFSVTVRVLHNYRGALVQQYMYINVSKAQESQQPVARVSLRIYRIQCLIYTHIVCVEEQTTEELKQKYFILVVLQKSKNLQFYIKQYSKLCQFKAVQKMKRYRN